MPALGLSIKYVTIQGVGDGLRKCDTICDRGIGSGEDHVIKKSIYTIFDTPQLLSNLMRNVKCDRHCFHSRRKHDVTCLVTPDVVGVVLHSDNNNFQPITRFVSLAMLGNEIVVSVTFLRYGGKHATCCL